MSDLNHLTAVQVATELVVSQQTLKNWVKEFAPFLSPAVSERSRRYTAQDLVVLQRIKDHLAAGLTFEETAEELHNAGYADNSDNGGTRDTMAMVAAQQGFSVLSDTMRAMVENQQTIQNSLQVNRNLLGVIIQDNFNLKEENSKLRERMLKLEQDLVEIKKRDSEYRLYLELRLNHFESALRAEAGKSFWQRLFGG